MNLLIKNFLNNWNAITQLNPFAFVRKSSMSFAMKPASVFTVSESLYRFLRINITNMSMMTIPIPISTVTILVIKKKISA